MGKSKNNRKEIENNKENEGIYDYIKGLERRMIKEEYELFAEDLKIFYEALRSKGFNYTDAMSLLNQRVLIKFISGEENQK